jgi:hypothetical protein
MTSIEWLIEQFNLQSYSPHIEQAKEMHKNEIIESYCYGCKDISNNENIFPRKTAEEYYNKTYDKTNG